MKLLFVWVLVVVVAQVFGSCGQGQTGREVVGWIEAKRLDRTDGVFVIVINGHEYFPPEPFWNQVSVGDLVKYEGGVWSIVRKGG